MNGGQAPPPVSRRDRRGRLPSIVLLILFAACRGGVTSRPSRTTPVILISVDTLRSDHLPAYGYKGVATPSLDALRADSILYEHAYSHCPLTLPSHTSMLTGLLPADHGIRDNIGFRLDAKIPTLAEALKKNGYATGAAVSAFVLRRESGIGRGFDFYDDEVEPVGPSQVIGRVQRDGTDTERVAKGWLDKQSGDKPFFLFMHLYDPHTPYTPPEPFLSTYKNHYDGEIAYVDQIVGDFIAYLKQRDLYDKAMIVFLSDHGEGLNEHGEEEHGIFLYREALQVPLLVKLPKSRGGGKSVAAPVELIDVFPTIIEQTATNVPKPEKQSESLLAFLSVNAPQRSVYSETFYPRFHFGWSDLHSLIDGDHHFIRAPIPELYDLARDPGEKTNAIESNRRTYVAMRAAIEPYVRQATAPTNIDPEEAAKLAALGYVGSTVSTSGNEQLPDPKTTIDVFRQIRVAFTMYRDNRENEALALTNKLLQDNRRILDLWDIKSKILQKLGRNEEAIEAAKEGLRQQPTAVGLMTAIANLSMSVGKLDQAQQHAELMLKTEPGQAHEIMARIAVQRGDVARAKDEALLAVKQSSDPTPAYLTLGLVEKQRGDLNAALKVLDQAAEKVSQRHNRRVPNLHLYRGDVLARLGRNEDAEREFRQEIAAFPQQPDAYSSLMLLLSAQGRVNEATQLVFDLVKASPKPPSYIAISETLKAIGDQRGALYWAYQGLQKFPTDPDLRRLLKSSRRVS
jgi:arylsulfatase A-like enzyme/tetratricopeptide (TPR) repeat protein